MRKNNNIYGKYSLFMKNNNKKQEINDDILIKIKKEVDLKEQDLSVKNAATAQLEKKQKEEEERKQKEEEEKRQKEEEERKQKN